MSAAQLPPLEPIEKLSPRVIRILGGNPGKSTWAPRDAFQPMYQPPSMDAVKGISIDLRRHETGTNTYLVGTGPNRILIDSAHGYEEWAGSLSSVLKSERATVSACLLTHWHPDHVLGVPDLLKLCPNAKVYKHASSVPSLVEVSREGADASVSGQSNENDTSGILEIKDGQVFETEGARLTAIHSPGHTDDHIAFLLEDAATAGSNGGTGDSGSVFAGDNVLGHGTSVFEDLGLYISSLGKMRRALQGAGLMYPAHGEVIQDGRAKIDEYVKHRKDRENQVVGVLSGDKEVESGLKSGPSGWTPMEVTRVIYRGVDEGLLEAAERGIKMILVKLEREGKVREDNNSWWVSDKARF